MNENDPSTNDGQFDVPRRLGRAVGLMKLAETQPQRALALPPWVMTCLQRVVEGCGRGAGQGLENMKEVSPSAVGLSMGSLGLMVSFIRNPEERWGQSLRPCLDAYYSSFFSTLGVSPPQNFWNEFSQGIFNLYLSFNYDQKLQFIEGLSLANEIENGFRTDKTNETTATHLYMELLLFWPEIDAMKSLPEVFRFLQTRFASTPSVLGDSERFRKAANRIGLSFQDQVSPQLSTDSPAPPPVPPPPARPSP